MDIDDNIKKRPKNKKVVKRKVKRDRKRDSVEIENIAELGKVFLVFFKYFWLLNHIPMINI